jgi:hypothetical protein
MRDYLDIFELADENERYLEKRYNEIRSNHENTNLDAFRDFVRENWTLSINILPLSLIGFLQSGKYFNIYELVELKSKQSGIPFEVLLKERLGEKYDRRLTFDRTFKDGDKFKYCALYLDGLGAEEYGDFCIVFKSDVVRSWNLAFVKNDTLNYVRRVGDNYEVDIDSLKLYLANKNCVHLLVAIKHHNEVDKYPKSEWGSMICGKDYIDSITTNDIRVEHIDYVKCRESVLRYYGRKILTHEPLTHADRVRVYEYISVIKLLKKRNIKLEVVECI